MLLFYSYSFSYGKYDNIFKSYIMSIKVCFYILDYNYKLNYNNYYTSEHFVNKFKVRCHHIFIFEPNETLTIYNIIHIHTYRVLKIMYLCFLIIRDITTILVSNLLLCE